MTGFHIHPGVNTLTEMPKVFNLSKINLNMTMRPIETGLPLRCFDILGCGGFLITNYQEELNDMFVIGQDLEAYSSLDELIDKCAYYLAHENERAAIAKNGYEKVRTRYTHIHRMREMLAAAVNPL
jgi:spore maturation protein CgeB